MEKINSYVIYVKSNKLSVESSKRTIKSAKEVGGLNPVPYVGFHQNESKSLLEKYKFNILDKERIWDKFCYFDSAIACFFSHFSLWEKSVKSNQRIMILEHDAVFTSKYIDFDFDGIINIGKPLWNILPNNDVRNLIDNKKETNLYQWDCKCEVTSDLQHSNKCSNFKCSSWCLRGAHSYIITPKSAEKLINKSYNLGIVPVDNHINRYNVDIAETEPYFTFQNSRFSLVTKHNKKYEGWVEGEEAWK